ncbi:MAG: peptide chain release factor N(5)-glutamine methyltransferase [Spirochaetaceae bacterium]|jgi:release factor glutamine methyltransferase|nr:peptide chain release factor N(5)-glutamine methyltransferase [Spirochaetaceae bacterium]
MRQNYRVKTFADTRRFIFDSLKKAGKENAALDAALLTAAALGITPSYLYAHPEDALSAEEQELCERFLERRLNGECTAYITGHKEFRFLNLHVDGHVLVPRPETETLVEAALRHCNKIITNENEGGLLDAVHVLDLCTGSGAVALALKYERPALEVYASDISEEALNIAAKNAGLHNLDVHFIQSNLFESISGTFNLITANAPYIPAPRIQSLPPEVKAEPRLALDGGKDGLDLIRAIIMDAPRYLRSDGALMLEASPEQMPDITRRMQNAGFSDVQIYNDLAGRGRVAASFL